MDLNMTLNVDFRIKNTFIEWVPRPDIEAHKILAKSASWDGCLRPTTSSFKTSALPEPTYSVLRTTHLEKEIVKESSDDLSFEFLRECPLKHALGNTSQLGRPGLTSQRFIAGQHGKYDSANSMAKEHVRGQRQAFPRPSKRIRQLCSQLVQALVDFYKDDEAMLCQVGWKLASQAAYLKGLCLKHGLPVLQGPWPQQEAQQDILSRGLPPQIQRLWAQVFVDLHVSRKMTDAQWR
eukprot:TRINITY_DN108744_c0_g1_i1.p1 TRINITY_DN108744_c0_g1~~TRINITY_DN108744_c0_g1_i1.p1  ORF type:complete len:236 (+),score=46.82 TRINITY_DN108744_c0_g1_i1:73-780(+)